MALQSGTETELRTRRISRELTGIFSDDLFALTALLIFLSSCSRHLHSISNTQDTYPPSPHHHSISPIQSTSPRRHLSPFKNENPSSPQYEFRPQKRALQATYTSICKGEYIHQGLQTYQLRMLITNICHYMICTLLREQRLQVLQYQKLLL